MKGVGVVGEARFLDASKGCVELVLVEQESVVLGLDVFSVGVGEGDPVAELNRHEWAPLFPDG